MRGIRTYTTTLLVSATLLASSMVAAEWNIDSSHSSAQFAVKHMMVSTVRGSFDTMSGTVSYDPAAPEKASMKIEIEAASVNTGNSRRDDHLRNADFFEVEKFPTITFESTRVERAGEGNLKLTGNMTMHGVTKEVTFDIEGPASPLNTERGMRTGALATTRISRKDFGLTWNRALEAGGVTVSDEVAITIDVELTEVRPPADS